MTCCGTEGRYGRVSRCRLGRSARPGPPARRSLDSQALSHPLHPALVIKEAEVLTQLSAGIATNNTASTIAKMQVKPFVSTVVRMMRCTIGRECW